MRITMESTSQKVTLSGVEARIWEGQTESGVKCYAFVTRIMVHEGQDNSQFERELQEHKPPSAEVQAIPLRMIL